MYLLPVGIDLKAGFIEVTIFLSLSVGEFSFNFTPKEEEIPNLLNLPTYETFFPCVKRASCKFLRDKKAKKLACSIFNGAFCEMRRPCAS